MSGRGNLTAYNTKLAIKVLQRIRVRTKANPVKAKVLALEFGYRDTRVITQVVAVLRDSGEWICATQEEPYGYYYADNRAQLEEYLEKEHERVIEQLARHKKQRDFTPKELTLLDFMEQPNQEAA